MSHLNACNIMRSFRCLILAVVLSLVTALAVRTHFWSVEIDYSGSVQEKSMLLP